MYDEAIVRGHIHHACAVLAPDIPHRLRLALKQDGTCLIQTGLLTPLSTPVKLLLAPEQMISSDVFLRHKTTVRERYDAAWRAAEEQGAFDMLFSNERGEITEGGRSSLFVKIDGRWYTPPLTSGVLPGVMRAVLLADPAWAAVERTLTIDDLRRAQEIVVCNALRGALQATIIWD